MEIIRVGSSPSLGTHFLKTNLADLDFLKEDSSRQKK